MARTYMQRRGLGPAVEGVYVAVDSERARRIADAFEALPLLDQSPQVIRAYRTFAEEICDQWEFARQCGIRFEPWLKDGQPYQSSLEMMEDLRNCRHLYFYQGGDPHPLFGEIDPATGYSINDKFRAIHDLFGHAAEGYSFGPRGEENTWIKHSQMFTREAQRALTTETRGQNAWVNFGRHNYNATGRHTNLPLSQRPYAPQKAALLPDEFTDWRVALL